MIDKSLIKWLPIFGEFAILALIIVMILGFMIGYIKPTAGGYIAVTIFVFLFVFLHFENTKHFDKDE